jgi:DNA-binding YbaB/EbfC family protein
MMNNLQQLIQMGQQLQAKMNQLQEELADRAYEASAGGGMVTATVDGRGHLKSVTIDSSVVDPSDVEMLEDLVLAAVAEAQSRARSEVEQEMKKLAGGMPMPMNLPGLF